MILRLPGKALGFSRMNLPTLSIKRYPMIHAKIMHKIITRVSMQHTSPYINCGLIPVYNIPLSSLRWPYGKRKGIKMV